MFSIFTKLLFSPCERIKQAQLCVRREQRLVIVWPMEIDKLIAETLQDRQSRRRTVDELPRPARDRETSFDMRSFSHGSIPASASCAFSFCRPCPLKTASTVQISVPVRINDLSARSPSKT